METIVVAPPSSNGDSILWDKTLTERGVVLTPPGCPDTNIKYLYDFAAGDYSLHQALQQPGAKELTWEDTNTTSAKVVDMGTTAQRFYTDRLGDFPNDRYTSWLSSNLMLENALKTNPKYVCVGDGNGGWQNIQVEPVEYLGASLFTLPNGLRSTLTLMSRAPGRRVLDLCLEGEGVGTGLNSFFERPEFVFLEAVASCVIDSMYATYPSTSGLLFIDPHERNMIIDQKMGKITVIDVNGIALPLGNILGANSLADLDKPIKLSS